MKNPFENMTPRSIRLIFTAVTIIVLGVSLLNFMDIMVYRAISNDQCAWEPVKGRDSVVLITDIVPGGVTDKAGIKDGDLLLKINGEGFRNGVAAMRIINPLPAGAMAVYLLERDGVQFEREVEILKTININYLGIFLLGLGFLIVGYIVVMTKPQGKVQRMFGRFSIFSMLLFALSGTYINFDIDPFWKVSLLVSGSIIGRLLAPPLFITFFLNFPVRKKILDRKWFIVFLYVLNTLIVATLIVNNLITSLRIPLLIQALALAPFIFYISGLIIFIHSYFKYVDVARRHQLRPIFISIIFGVAAFIHLAIVSTTQPMAFFLNPNIFLPGLLIVIVPIAFGYSIFKYRLMDIEFIIKKSLIYGAITATIAAIYIIFVFGIGSALSEILGHSDNQILSVVAFLVIAFLFDPIKRRIQGGIDRIFYQERYNYQKALLEFSRELPAQINLEQILNSMVNRISNTMHIEKIAVLICDPIEGCYCVNKNIPDSFCSYTFESGGLLSLLQKTKTPQSFTLLVEEPESIKITEEDKQRILSSGIVLSVPMFLKDRLIGAINVGPKLSGKIYSQEDVDLLFTVASQAAIAIENGRLHLLEVEKKRIEEELEIARRIQIGLLPKNNPIIDGLDIVGISIPALTVGGDYFDYIQYGPKKLLTVIADVSGKGIPAALYMSKIQGMVQLAAHIYQSPRDILINVNRRIYDGIDRKSFITMIIALFDLENKKVTICRAGHNKVMFSSDGDVKYLDSQGIGLGLEYGPLFEDTLEEIQLDLEKDGLFLFYTDGLTETMNRQKAELGEETVRNLIRANKNLSAVDLQKLIIDTSEKFREDAEQHDDITLIVTKCK